MSCSSSRPTCSTRCSSATRASRYRSRERSRSSCRRAASCSRRAVRPSVISVGSLGGAGSDAVSFAGQLADALGRFGSVALLSSEDCGEDHARSARSCGARALVRRARGCRRRRLERVLRAAVRSPGPARHGRRVRRQPCRKASTSSSATASPRARLVSLLDEVAAARSPSSRPGRLGRLRRASRAPPRRPLARRRPLRRRRPRLRAHRRDRGSARARVRDRPDRRLQHRLVHRSDARGGLRRRGDARAVPRRARPPLAVQRLHASSRVAHPVAQGRPDARARVRRRRSSRSSRSRFFTVSADLLASRTVVHRRGLVLEAVGASMSIPGSFRRSRDRGTSSSTAASSTTCPST